jgi:hypothetical protein
MPSKWLLPDMRPSKANPEHRAARKQLENENPGFDWTPCLLLALLGFSFLVDVEKDVKRYEEKHKQREREEYEREGGQRERHARHPRRAATMTSGMEDTWGDYDQSARRSHGD